jgi:uncharacterized protein (TIGR00369 family)
VSAEPEPGPVGLDAEGIQRFLEHHYPQALGFPVTVGEKVDRTLTLTLAVSDAMLRPGGTISGPTLMTLADVAMYFLILSELGSVALAVTTSLHIDFLRRPAKKPIVARAELLKLGRTLAVGRVVMYSEGDPSPVAHASLTYALPPKR